MHVHVSGRCVNESCWLDTRLTSKTKLAKKLKSKSRKTCMTVALFACSYWIVLIDGCFFASEDPLSGSFFFEFFYRRSFSYGYTTENSLLLTEFVHYLHWNTACIFAIQKMLRKFLFAWTKSFLNKECFEEKVFKLRLQSEGLLQNTYQIGS
jgi:hypothetical protein